MEVEGVRSFRLDDGTVLLVFRERLDSAMRCWPLPTLFRRMQHEGHRDDAIRYLVRRSPPSPGSSDRENSWRESSLAAVDECLAGLRGLAERHRLPLAVFPIYQDLQRMRLDVLWNSDTRAQDVASLTMQTRAALMLWGNV